MFVGSGGQLVLLWVSAGQSGVAAAARDLEGRDPETWDIKPLIDTWEATRMRLFHKPRCQ